MSKEFGAASSTDDVLGGINLVGKTVVVTGTSAGLGIETARALVSHGARVLGGVRDLDKAYRATQAVRAAATGGGSFDLFALDLANLASVRSATEGLRAQLGSIDLIIANAGVMACPQGVTADGFETQFGTNHLGHFTFVNRLCGLLADDARVVLLSSGAHRFSDVDLDDPGFARSAYHPFIAYGRSKTANVLHAVALDARLRGRGPRVTAVHPGVIQTELGRHMTPDLLAQIMPSGDQPAFTFKTTGQGAATSVWAGVVAPREAVGGHYCEDCHVAELTDDPQSRTGVRGYALDARRAEALWALSETLVGESFDVA
ncbi:MAG: SDR family NAD(P)-dependent oxidoreductase [Pseudomonadales bacterium]